MNNSLPEPAYVTSLDELFWGTILVTITLTMHGFGMLAVLRANLYVKKWLGEKTHIVVNLFPVILASWMILLVHLVEVFAWTGFFLWQDAVSVSDGKANGSLCYYFALMDYTTLGCSYNLRERWRLLEGMIAMAGLLTFAWSTGVLMTLAQDFQDQQLQLLKQKSEKRHPKQAPAPPPAGKKS